jgi:hypothetical protein
VAAALGVIADLRRWVCPRFMSVPHPDRRDQPGSRREVVRRRAAARAALPPRADPSAKGRRPGSPPVWGITVADSTGIAPASPLQRRSGAMHPAQRMGELTPEAVEDAACTVEDHPRRCRARPWRRYCPVGLHPTRWRPPSWSAVRTRVRRRHHVRVRPAEPTAGLAPQARFGPGANQQIILCGVVVEDRVWRHPMARRGLRSPVIHEC